MNYRSIRELFIFTKKERNGIIVLLILIFILAAINISLPHIIKYKPVDLSGWKTEVEEYLAMQEEIEQKARPVPFDPNNVSREQLLSFGVPNQVVLNWIKYLEKGGKFYKREDVKKIYGMTPELFNDLEAYLIFKTPEAARISKISYVIQQKSSQRTYNPVNINAADSADLVQLPGIGPVLAVRIIKYRKLLGGFYSINQLKEVYGLREENFMPAEPYLTVDGREVRKFNINFSTVQDLGRNPYIGFKTARRIIDRRDRLGKFSAAVDLSGLMSADSLQKLSPYLTFN